MNFQNYFLNHSSVYYDPKNHLELIIYVKKYKLTFSFLFIALLPKATIPDFLLK